MTAKEARTLAEKRQQEHADAVAKRAEVEIPKALDEVRKAADRGERNLSFGDFSEDVAEAVADALKNRYGYGTNVREAEYSTSCSVEIWW